MHRMVKHAASRCMEGQAHPQGAKVWRRHILEPLYLVCRGAAGGRLLFRATNAGGGRRTSQNVSSKAAAGAQAAVRAKHSAEQSTCRAHAASSFRFPQAGRAALLRLLHQPSDEPAPCHTGHGARAQSLAPPRT